MLPADAAHYEDVEMYVSRWEFARTFDETGLKNSKILEIGCGEGFFISEANLHGNFVLGLDFNKEAVAVARKKQLNANIECIDSNYLDELRKNNQKFDMVAAFHIVEHFDNLRHFFLTSLDLLNHGGYLVIAVPSQKRPNVVFGNREWWDESPHHLTRWHKHTFHELAKLFPLEIKNIVFQPADLQFIKRELSVWFYNKFFSSFGKRGTLFRLANTITSPLSLFLYFYSKKSSVVTGNSVLLIMQKSSN